MSRLKGIILFVSLLYLTFYIPMSLTFYLPYWMRLNCGWHGRCEIIGYQNAYDGIDELNAYFRHQGELVTSWTRKEKLHLKEVRGIFDGMFFAGLAALVLLLLTFDKKRASRYALINAAVILCLVIVLPFFGVFWRDVFHPLLFKNNLWMNNRYDVSFYIMPRRFFMFTVALLITVSASVNLVIWLGLRNKSESAG
jgi:uncharacterized membrane protein